MSALTPTPLPKLRPDEATQPNLSPGMMPPDDARRGLVRSPAQWEAEALALVEEADARDGATAGALRYAAARLFEEGVGDVAAAMDHLRLALEEPPETTFRPVLRALRLHAIEAGSTGRRSILLDVERSAAGDVATRADSAVEKAYLLEHRLGAPARRGPCWKRRWPSSRAMRPRCWRWSRARSRRGPRRAGRRGAADVGAGAAAGVGPHARRARPPAGAAGAHRGGRSGARSRGARLVAARARRAGGPGRGGAGAGGGAAGGGGAGEVCGAGAGGRAGGRGPSVIERAAWLALGAALSRHRLGGPARAAELIEEARPADPDDPALLFATVSSALAGGQWKKARQALDHQADLSGDRDWAATLVGLGAHLAELHEGNDDAAAGRYRRLLEARPGDPVALAALERIASRTGDAAAQVTLAEGAVDRSADPAERAALAMRAAELAETAAHDLPRAAALARRALEAVPGYAPAAHLLERLLPALGRWDEMAKVVDVTAAPGALGEAGTEADTGARAIRLERLGALHEDRLGDPGKALAFYGEWVALGTRRGAALAALLRAAEKAGDALVAAEAALKLGTESRLLTRRPGSPGATAPGPSSRSARRPTTRRSAPTRRRWRWHPIRARCWPVWAARITGAAGSTRSAGCSPVRRPASPIPPAPAPSRWRRRVSRRSVWGAPRRRWRRRRAR